LVFWGYTGSSAFAGSLFCHAGGRGFESRPDRNKALTLNELGLFAFQWGS